MDIRLWSGCHFCWPPVALAWLALVERELFRLMLALLFIETVYIALESSPSTQPGPPPETVVVVSLV